MKKLLSLIGALALSSTATATVVACGKSDGDKKVDKDIKKLNDLFTDKIVKKETFEVEDNKEIEIELTNQLKNIFSSSLPETLKAEFSLDVDKMNVNEEKLTFAFEYTIKKVDSKSKENYSMSELKYKKIHIKTDQEIVNEWAEKINNATPEDINAIITKSGGIKIKEDKDLEKQKEEIKKIAEPIINDLIKITGVDGLEAKDLEVTKIVDNKEFSGKASLVKGEATADVSIENIKFEIKKGLNDFIKTTALGEITGIGDKPTEDEIDEVLKEKNDGYKGRIETKTTYQVITETGANLFAGVDSDYQGSVSLTFTYKQQSKTISRTN